MHKAVPYSFPPKKLNGDGEMRRVGIELEFTGIEPQQVADIVAAEFDGRCEKKTEAEYLIECDGYDDFCVELDWQFAKSMARRRLDQDDKAMEDNDDQVMMWMTKIAGQLVPVEIVCPPIPIDQLHRLDNMVSRLRQAGAIGTEQSFLYAFGVHLNPELPDLEPATVSAYLQAFALSQDWLVEKHRVDLSRKITPYINLFTDKYIHTVVGYAGRSVSLNQIIDDYLIHNATRNRALDMLPLFKHIDQRKIDDALSDVRINSRPTFHYRLPNCEIEREGWLLRESWSIWCVIEYLAATPGALHRLIDQWRTWQAELLNFSDKSWHNDLDTIYSDLSSG